MNDRAEETERGQLIEQAKRPLLIVSTQNSPAIEIED